MRVCVRVRMYVCGGGQGEGGVRECVSLRVPNEQRECRYGVATVSRIDQIIGLFCRISSLL